VAGVKLLFGKIVADQGRTISGLPLAKIGNDSRTMRKNDEVLMRGSFDLEAGGSRSHFPPMGAPMEMESEHVCDQLISWIKQADQARSASPCTRLWHNLVSRV
jgi:hypothetical protein